LRRRPVGRNQQGVQGQASDDAEAQEERQVSNGERAEAGRIKDPCHSEREQKIADTGKTLVDDAPNTSSNEEGAAAGINPEGRCRGQLSTLDSNLISLAGGNKQ
jgi:hypothetical protein